MKVREAISRLIEINDLDMDLRVINVNDPRDEFDSDSRTSYDTSSVSELDSEAVLYFVGDKPPREDDDE